jgi:hypothetical protein
MALSGVHVACGFAGGQGAGGFAVQIGRPPVWSETLAAASTTVNVAPPYRGERDAHRGSPTFEIRASVDVFIAIGPVPDASQTVSTMSGNSRLFVPAGETRNVFCNPNDKLAWVAA